EVDAEPLQAVPLPVFIPPSKYPPVVRDMALVVDAGLPAQALLEAMAAEKPAIVTSIQPFDLYQGPGVPTGRKSLAFRVVMQHTERTLTDAEADAARDALVSLLARTFSASLRKYRGSGEILMTLTKAELADLLFEKVGLNKREAKDMVEAFFEEIRGALERGESVKLSGFGNFQLRDKPQRPGRNPKTGEEIPISARRVVTFHASQKLKALVEKARHGAKPQEG